MNNTTKIFRIVFIVFILVILGFTFHFMTKTKAPWNRETDKVNNLEVVNDTL